MNFVKESKGRGCKYISENMIFSQYAIKLGVPYLSCDYTVAGKKCDGRAKIVDNKLIVTHAHSHDEVMTSEIEKLQLVNRCKKRAAEVTSESLRFIFDDEARGTPAAVATSLAFNNIESAMYKRRRLTLPPLPQSVEDAATVINSSEYASIDGHRFFQADVASTDGGMALLFASPAQLLQLSSAESVYIDGTFRTVPRLFYQLFTLFISVQNFVFPVLFVLMTKKSTDLYRRVFEKVHALTPAFAPNHVMGDYEDASVRAVKDVFGPNISVNGCWFHFAQSIVRKAKRLGLNVAFKEDGITRKCIRAACALPLLTAEAIPGALTDITALAGTAQGEGLAKLLTLCDYVRHRWVEKASVGPTRMSVADRSDRTNNGVESFHAAFAKRVKVAHPNLFTFLAHLRNTSKDTISEITRLTSGLTIRRRKKKAYLDSDIRIRRAMIRHASGQCTSMEFLLSVSHCADNVTAALEAPMDTGSDTISYNPSASDEDHVANDDDAANDDNVCDVCRINNRVDIALVPCGHARFCRPCADTLVQRNLHCPLCRSNITTVMPIFR